MICKWCETENASFSTCTVYWELPDGSKAVTITETPCIACIACGMEYQEDSVTREIEDQLFLINTRGLESELKFETLMAKPRLLKRNYFDFSS